MKASKIFFCSLIFLSLTLFAYSQELFPYSDPASNIPKDVLGIKIMNEFYNEGTQLRSWQGYKFSWGFSPKWMFTETFNFSNHHGSQLPSDFVKTDSSGNLFTNGVKKGNKYLYVFENFSMCIKYRFLNRDGEKKHFRMAAYMEVAGGNQAHYDAEPDLLGDNSGLSGGLIATLLKNKFAVSLNSGFILPYHYSDLPLSVQIQYGKAMFYNLSFGYLLLPKKYKNYNQVNVNLYCEFKGMSYGKANIIQNGHEVAVKDFPNFESGNYIEVCPAIQFIFKSNTRLDFSIGYPMLNKSYVHYYPVYYCNLQRYFYF